MRTKYNKFQPDRNRFMFNIAVHDKNYRRKLANAKLRNIDVPKKNELFSSWLARNATINFMQTSTFVNKYFAEYRYKLLNRDMDILVDKEILENFSERTGVGFPLLMQTSLKSCSGYLSEAIRDNTRNNLISPIKIKGTYNNLYGLKYCPLCLQEDDYFKKEWRLAFYNVCTKHKTMLLDRCPNCGKQLTITKRKRDLPYFNCWNCGFIYKEAPIQEIPKESKSLETLHKTMDILTNGYFQFDGKYYYSLSYFRIVKHIAKLIFQFGYRKNNILEKEQELFQVKMREKKYVEKKFLEEIITLKESLILFTTVFHVLSSKENLEQFIEENEIPYHHLIKDLKENDDIPFFYENVVLKYYGGKYSPPYNEVKNAIRWMKKNNITINWTNVRKLLGVYLDPRKRPELIELIQNNL